MSSYPVSFDFYISHYRGARLNDPGAFYRRAGDAMRILRQYDMDDVTEEDYELCICALADYIDTYDTEKRQTVQSGIKSESVGDVSVTYASISDIPAMKKEYEAGIKEIIALYIGKSKVFSAFYRGVSRDVV